jgi:hypothetical protein
VTDLRLIPRSIVVNPLTVNVKDLAGRAPASVTLEISPAGNVQVQDGLYEGTYTFSQWDQKLGLQATFLMEDGSKVVSPRIVKDWQSFVAIPYFSADLSLPVYLPGSLVISGRTVFFAKPKKKVDAVTIRAAACGSAGAKPDKEFTLSNEKTVRANAAISIVASAQAPPGAKWEGDVEVKAVKASIKASDILLVQTAGFEDVLNNLRASSQRATPGDNSSTENLSGPDLDRVREENDRRGRDYENRMRQEDEARRQEQERTAAEDRRRQEEEARLRQEAAERQNQEMAQVWQGFNNALIGAVNQANNPVPPTTPEDYSPGQSSGTPSYNNRGSQPAAPSRRHVRKPSSDPNEIRRKIESCKVRRQEIIKELAEARTIAAELRSGRRKSYSGLQHPDVRVRDLEGLLVQNADWIKFYEKELAASLAEWAEYNRNK